MPTLKPIFEAGRLITLAEIMRKFVPALFVTRIVDDTYHRNLLGISAERIKQEIKDAKAQGLDTLEILTLRASATIFNRKLFPVTYKLYEEIIKEMRTGDFDEKILMGKMDSACSSLIEELKRYRFFRLSRSERKLYDSKHPFGESVSKKFRTLSVHVDNAAKCRALGQYTSCGMHCVKIFEAILEKLAEKMKQPLINPKTSNRYQWHELVEILESKIRKLPAQGDIRREQFKEEAGLALQQIMLIKPMRHSLQHPRRNLTPKQAATCYDGTKGFMSQVADHNLLTKAAHYF